MQWKSSRFKRGKVHIFILVIFFKVKNCHYIFLCMFLYKHHICFISDILGRVNNDVMNEEGKERPQSTFHDTVCRLEKIKRASFKPGSASLLPWSMVTCPRWSWSLHCLDPSFIYNTQEAAENRNLRWRFELRSVSKDHVFFYSYFSSPFFFLSSTRLLHLQWMYENYLKALISA
jgi:hypothetical protein